MSTEPQPDDPAQLLTFVGEPQLSLRGDRTPFFPARLRGGVGVSILLLHGVVLLWLVQPETQTKTVASQAIEVFFVDATRRPSPPPPAIRRPRDAFRPKVRDSTPVAVAPAPAPDVSAGEESRPRLFDVDGTIALPEGVLKDLAAVTDPRRSFSYQMPGLMQAREFLDRPPALTYEATRFESGWIEEADPLTEALAKAVEKTTATIRIPLPRAPGSTIVCKVSLLAMGGACGIVNNGEGYLVVLDDPHTLDDEEDAQCRAWWAALVEATTPEQWRAALDRYERECRKPLLVPRDVTG